MKKSWDNITLREYFSVIDILKDTERGEDEKVLDLMELLSGVDNFGALRVSELSKHMPDITFITKEPPAVDIGDSVDIGGVAYAVANEKTMTAAQFISFQTAIKRAKTDTARGVASVLRCLLKRRGAKNSDEGCPSVEEVEGMNAAVAFSLLAFFLPKCVLYAHDTLDYLARVATMAGSTANGAVALISSVVTDGR